ncbi:aminoglycoside phosphotransferase family protein [Streptomyces sp. NPDC087317]|uniref:aminoglycoside phosphotransferase family protein n=1 Tax=Streptomyces sp. NPDC087317 TaxID=3365784 RepID=UPI0037F420A4
MSTAASTYPDLPPEEVRQLAEQAVGRIATWTDASWDRDSSRVWRADGAQEGVWYVKIHQNTRFHHREVDAYRSWVPGLGTSAPTLVTSDSALLAVVITTVPGRPLDGIDHPPEQQRLLFRQIGALAAAIHGSAAPLSAEEGMPALAKVERHLEAARPYLRPGDEVFIRQIVARAEAVPPLDRVPTHGDFQLRNLLLDDDGSLAVIDFERSEPGPAIRDVVRLADAWATQPRLRPATAANSPPPKKNASSSTPRSTPFPASSTAPPTPTWKHKNAATAPWRACAPKAATNGGTRA